MSRGRRPCDVAGPGWWRPGRSGWRSLGGLLAGCWRRAAGGGLLAFKGRSGAAVAWSVPSGPAFARNLARAGLDWAGVHGMAAFARNLMRAGLDWAGVHGMAAFARNLARAGLDWAGVHGMAASAGNLARSYSECALAQLPSARYPPTESRRRLPARASPPAGPRVTACRRPRHRPPATAPPPLATALVSPPVAVWMPAEPALRHYPWWGQGSVNV